MGPMDQRPRVVRDIAKTCVVLHNMMTHQGGEDRAPTPRKDGVALKMTRQCGCPMRTAGILRGRENINKNYLKTMLFM